MRELIHEIAKQPLPGGGVIVSDIYWVAVIVFLLIVFALLILPFVEICSDVFYSLFFKKANVKEYPVSMLLDFRQRLVNDCQYYEEKIQHLEMDGKKFKKMNVKIERLKYLRNKIDNYLVKEVNEGSKQMSLEELREIKKLCL